MVVKKRTAVDYSTTENEILKQVLDKKFLHSIRCYEHIARLQKYPSFTNKESSAMDILLELAKTENGFQTLSVINAKSER